MAKYTIQFKNDEEKVMIAKDKLELSNRLFKYADKQGYTRDDLVSIKTKKTVIYNDKRNGDTI